MEEAPEKSKMITGFVKDAPIVKYISQASEYSTKGKNGGR